MAWPTANLGDICDINIGRTPRRDTPAYWGGTGTWVTIRDMKGGTIRHSREQISDKAMREVMPAPTAPGTVLFSFKLTIGKTAIAQVPLYTNEAIASLPIKRGDLIETKFLQYALSSLDPELGANHAVLGKVLNKEKLQHLQVPLPPLAEQQRIVEILDRAAAIQRLRRAAEEKAREIIPALFVDMFGDPATNPKGWPVGTLAAVVDEFRYGTSMKSGATGVPVLRIPNVIGGALDTKEIKLVQLTQAELRRLTLADGDLLFVRTNGNPDYVGRSAIYDDQRMIDAGYAPNASVYASYLIRARLNRSVCPAFIQAQLSSAEGRRHFRERSRTSAGQYNINTESLGTIPLMLPPLSLQLAFAEKAKAVTNMSPTTSLAKQTTEGVVSALSASVLG